MIFNVKTFQIENHATSKINFKILLFAFLILALGMKISCNNKFKKQNYNKENENNIRNDRNNYADSKELDTLTNFKRDSV